MTGQEVLRMLKRFGGILTDDHFVYTSGRHGSSYVNKNALYPRTREISLMCLALAERFDGDGIEAVIAPAIGGIVMSQWVAHHLSVMAGKEILGVFVEKAPDGGFAFTREYDRLVSGKNVLAVEDVLTTGGSLRKVIEATRAADGRVGHVAALCNRGSLSIENFPGIRKFTVLLDFPLESWDPAECPLCAAGVPVNARFGKGAR